MADFDSVSCNGVMYHLLPGTFYHLTSANDCLLWNVRLCRGLCMSASMLADTEELRDVVTPYYVANTQSKKECLWEEIRQSEFPHLPSRQKSLFLVDTLEAAHIVQKRWFPNESRHILAARVISSATLHKADTKWLDTPESEWESSARSYWSADMTGAPMIEAIIYGCVYFPRWREPPFGIPPTSPS